MEKVILVDASDNPIGLMEKMEAHRKGLLHRAFSVFIFNDKNELLMQRRALHKYHSGGLWTNTCCSHPRENETTKDAGKRRLQEEMGFQVELTEVFSFTYKAKLDNELIEHEYDHVLIGNFTQAPVPNAEEVSEWKYVSLDDLSNEITNHPENFTVWFLEIFDRVKTHFLKEH